MFVMKKGNSQGQIDPEILIERKVYVPDKLKIDWSNSDRQGFMSQTFLHSIRKHLKEDHGMNKEGISACFPLIKFARK